MIVLHCTFIIHSTAITTEAQTNSRIKGQPKVTTTLTISRGNTTTAIYSLVMVITIIG